MDILPTQEINTQIQSAHLMLLAITAILHIIFAGAVARDAGQLQKRGIPVFLVSGLTWAFATLIGGVVTAAIYWFMHHVRWNQNTTK